MIPFSLSLSRYSALAFGVLIGACLFFLPAHFTLNKSEQNYLDAYGQALADAVARESVEAIFRNDLVSLRAIVQASAENPFVIRVSLRSVEQKTLAQAGPVLHELPDVSRTFESPITLHDSIAGAATVILDTGVNSHSNYLGGFIVVVLLCLGVIAWSFNKQGLFSAIWAGVAQTRKIDNDHLNDDMTEPEKADSFDEAAYDEDLPRAYLALCVKNASVLQHQLNGETYRRTFKQLENRVQQVGKLYGLAESQWSKDRYILTFSASAPSIAAFHAACAGKLLLDLAGIIHRVPLDLSAQISMDEDRLLDIEMPFVGLAISDDTQMQDLLEGKVEHLNLSDNDARRLISGFASPYAELLKKQIEQFQAKPFSQ